VAFYLSGAGYGALREGIDDDKALRGQLAYGTIVVTCPYRFVTRGIAMVRDGTPSQQEDLTMRRLVMIICLITLSACSSVNQPQAAPEDAVTATLPPPAADAHGKVGQPVENGGVALTVISTTLTSQIDQATPAGAGEAYLIADVLLENTGSGKVSYDRIFFSVLDANSVEYISSPVAPALALKSGDLMPGDKVRGNVAFKMKAAATGLTIKYQPVVMGHSPRIYITVP
jgi:hypothetical protein